MTRRGSPRSGSTRSVTRPAPVDYRPVRPAFQRVRAGFALALLLAGFVGLANDAPDSWVKIGVAALVVGDATYRSLRDGGVVGSLLVDAVLVAAVIGWGSHRDAALIAFFAYLIITASLLAARTPLALILGTAVVVVSTRVALFDEAVEDDVEPLVEALGWIHVGILLLATALVAMTGAALMHQSRRRSDQALDTERRAGEIKNDFVSMVSHELRTPLTNITGFALTVQDSWRVLDPDEVDEFLGIICDESAHLKNLVEDILVIPRLEAGRLPLDVTNFPLRPAVFKVVDVLFPGGADESTSVAIDGNVIVRADPNRVEQVLRNLLDNARKYGGDQISVEATRDGDEYTVAVGDNGPGVPVAERERIFDRFEQLSTGHTNTGTGIGLGLAITRRLIETMGGRVWYEPGFPVGARFCFTLPVGRRQPAMSEPSASQPSAVAISGALALESDS